MIDSAWLKRSMLLGSLLGAALTCTGTLEPGSTENPPTLTITATPTAGVAPLAVSVRAQFGPDTQAYAVIDWRDSARDSLALPTGVLVRTHTYHRPGTYWALGRAAARDGRSATDSTLVTVGDLPPAISRRSLGADTVVVGDSVVATLQGRDNLPDIWLRIDHPWGTDSVRSADSTGTLTAVIHPTDARLGYVRFGVSDNAGHRALDSLPLRSRYSTPALALTLQNRWDVPPHQVTGSVRATNVSGLDSLVVTWADTTQHIPARTRDTLLALQHIYAGVGHRQVCVGAFGAGGQSATACDSVFTLMQPPTPPVLDSFDVVTAVVREVDSLVVRGSGHASRGLQSVVLADSIPGRAIQVVATLPYQGDTSFSFRWAFKPISPGYHILRATAADRSSAAEVRGARTAHVLRRPIITALTPPAAVDFSPGRTIEVAVEASGDSGLVVAQCVASTAQSYWDSSTTQFHLRFDNPSHAADTMRVAGRATCRDSSGMVSDTQQFTTLTRHSHPVRLETYSILTDSLTERHVIANGDTLFTLGGNALFYIRPGSLVLADRDTRWAGVRVDRHWRASTQITGEDVSLPVYDSMLVRMGSLRSEDSAYADSLSVYTTRSPNGSWILGGFPDSATSDTSQPGIVIPVVEVTSHGDFAGVPADSVRAAIKAFFDTVSALSATPDHFGVRLAWGAPVRAGRPYYRLLWYQQGGLGDMGQDFTCWEGSACYGDGPYEARGIYKLYPVYWGVEDIATDRSAVHIQDVFGCWPFAQAYYAALARSFKADRTRFFTTDNAGGVTSDYGFIQWFNAAVRFLGPWGGGQLATVSSCGVAEIMRIIPRALAYLGPGYVFKQ